MTRADIAFWNAVNTLPITMDGVSEGMWAITLIIILVLILSHDATKPRKQYRDYPPHRPPHYPPY